MTITIVKRVTLVHMETVRGPEMLTCYGYRCLAVNHRTRLTPGKVHINGLEGFWSDMQEKRLKRYGVSTERFPCDLYERQV